MGQFALYLVGAYLAGAVPFGLVIAKLAKGIDPRKAGSGNIGATNVSRLCGFGWGVLTLILDVLKGYAPVYLAGAFFGSFWLMGLAGAATVLGHMYPVFLGFKGGKGVATAIGTFLAIPLVTGPAFMSIGLCLAAIAVSGFVSVGSLVLVISLPVILWLMDRAGQVPLATILLIAALVIWKHKENIKRLLAGQEKPWRKKSA